MTHGMTILSALTLMLFSCTTAGPGGSVTEDPRFLEEAYVDAWLAGDDEGVLDLFEPDAVIIPSGSEPRTGREEIVEFWFPDDGSTTVIDSYETTLDGYRIDGDVAWWWGDGTLSFTWTSAAGEVFKVEDQKSVYTAIARRDEAGGWHFVHRAWSSLQQD